MGKGTIKKKKNSDFRELQKRSPYKNPIVSKGKITRWKINKLLVG